MAECFRVKVADQIAASLAEFARATTAAAAAMRDLRFAESKALARSIRALSRPQRRAYWQARKQDAYVLDAILSAKDYQP
jgi:hypothetical protein